MFSDSSALTPHPEWAGTVCEAARLFAGISPPVDLRHDDTERKDWTDRMILTMLRTRSIAPADVSYSRSQ
ncbi:hypothetical protein BQ8794_200045 [Mesorhizobium prunaredense]|uniref:Uncharacterized protein n=1 Tax=Mesorhizobium prunaredense TaxID=1631249 RepID=A0A1R3V576_9HYPH|nr:hypothetical protein BQ8794_200045 [Mesorhizobium prunaredense]